MKKEKPPLTKEQIAALSPGSVCKFIISKFIKKESINWARDISCIKKLVELIPNPLFWNAVYPKEPIFDAAPQMLTENSIKFLTNKYNLWKLDLLQETAYTLSDTKQGEDVIIEQNEKSLMEFLES